MAVLFQVHFRSREEPMECSHRERKAELHLDLPPSWLRADIVPHIRSYANVSSLV
jgi:hypothetical protein